jgi:hypothetical protein
MREHTRKAILVYPDTHRKINDLLCDIHKSNGNSNIRTPELLDRIISNEAVRNKAIMSKFEGRSWRKFK